MNPATIRLDNAGVQTQSITGDIHWRLRDVSVTFSQSDRVGVIGPNGSGKSTLARLLSRLDQPTSGKVIRQPVTMRAALVLQRPEDHFTQHTVFHEILRFLQDATDRRDVFQFMNQVNLPRELQDRSPYQLSNGEQRLLAIACALATRPQFLIMDEPMAGLDEAHRERVAQTLRSLTESAMLGLCIISHHPDDLIGLVDRLWVLQMGRLQYDGPLANCPISFLDQCLSAQDASVYRWLRRLAEYDFDIPNGLYTRIDVDELQMLLNSWRATE